MLNSIGKAALWSLPVCGFVILDSVLWASGDNLLTYFHAPGVFLSIALGPLRDDFHSSGSMVWPCIFNCVLYFLLVWLIVVIVQRRRSRLRPETGSSRF
jgi:hypothetical protein